MKWKDRKRRSGKVRNFKLKPLTLTNWQSNIHRKTTLARLRWCLQVETWTWSFQSRCRSSNQNCVNMILWLLTNSDYSIPRRVPPSRLELWRRESTQGFAKINVNTPGLKLWALNAPKFIVELNFRTFKLDLESPRPVSTMYPRFFRGTGRTEEEEERRSEIYSTASTWWSFRVRVAVSFRIRGWLYPGPSRLEVLWDEFEYFCAAPI